MKTKKLLLYLIILILASCKPEEQPPVVSYVFSDVSVEAGQTSATITCRNESVDDDKVHASVLLSKNENITDATKYPMRLQNDTLRSTITGLESNTMYYFCFEVYTANEHKRTDEVHHFQTTDGGGHAAITVTTSEAINVTQTTATGGGSVTAEGDYTVSMRGVCWDTVSNPNVVQSPHLVSGEGAGSFMVNITELSAGTTYHMRAYAVCNDVPYYGNEVVFTTQSAQSPTVTTGEVANITRTSALASGNVTNDGGTEVTRRGVCWSTGHSPSVEGSHTDNGSGTGAYTVEITNLTPNTTYFVRAYAENAQGISYGEEVEFTTAQDFSSPTVVTGSVEGTTAHGEVTSDGGAEVTERGICWGTEHAPTTEGMHATSGAGVGSFSVELTDLTPGTTYYVRAYARNSVGTAYGNEVSFSTTANKPTVTTEEVSNITQTTAQGGGNVTDDGGVEVTERGICWSTNHNPTTSGSHANSGTGMGGYTVNMTGLTANTTYYVRAYATNSQGTSYGEEMSFKTSQNHSAPTVTTSQVTNITQTTATGGGNVTSDGGATVTERGVCWSTSHNPTTSGSHANSGTGTGSYTVNITGLTANTTYYVRAYAKNSEGTSYGAEVSFQTSATKPTVTTNQVSNITQTTATGGGNVTDGGGANVTARGVCWSTSHNPTTSNSHTTNGTGTGSFTSSITGLTANTTYYVRAYATNSAGTAYGAEVSFTTGQNVTTPTVTTSQVTNITQTTATGGGNVTNSGNATVTARGVCWSTSHNPTTSSSHTTDGTGTGSFTSNITGLTANTTYYVRAYATNSAGTAYGAEVSFTTSQNVTTPTVTTSQVTNITQTTATGGGNVTNSGNATVTARGVCWSTSHNPTTSNSHTTDGTGTGSFTSSITGLTANTTYYVRAYATNSAGTAYGAEVSFTTSQNVTTPTVTTSQVTNITQTTATGGGNVTSDGGASVTARGVCWSTNHNPTVSGSHTTNGTGTGSFTSSLTGLTANTTYYVRAYATNSAGTAYGAEVSFTTSQNVTMPTVTTSQVTNITQTTATGGGNVTSDGGANVTARGVCWSTSHNPTTSSSHTTDGAGTGSFTSNITGLTANTTYYVRAYAINSAGTAYGAEVSFTTSQNVTLPTVTTSQVTNITQTTATGGGNVTSDGGASVTARGVCWSTSHNPTTSNSHTTNGTGTGSFTSSLTGLTANTTYYVRAYATNSAGTAYGSEVSFTTQQVPSYTISVSASPTNGGTVTGGGTYQQGQSCTVSATASSGYTFINWTENGNVVSTNANYTFTVNANRTLVANFSMQSYTISVSASPSNGGSVSGGGNYNYGQSCTVHATANSGYTFTNWTENGTQVSTNPNYSFTVISSRTLVAHFTAQPQAPIGAINGLFTINANGDQVYFSQGNLQYQASTDIWKFAENQYDYIGNTNSNISSTYSGWIDLFGWGTSGWNSGNTFYHPWDSNDSDGNLYGPPGLYDLTGSYANADWGIYNPISNGDNQTNQWRTLTIVEWRHVFNIRTTTSGIRYAKANVNNVNGVILLPDDWSSSTYSLNNTNSSGASFSSNTLTASQWSSLEQAGAVFLPAAGIRYGTSIDYVGSCGQYWSASRRNTETAYDVEFSGSSLNMEYHVWRCYGRSVRLVHNAQ